MAYSDPLPSIVAYLAAGVTPVRVVADVPDPRPPTLLQVYRVGGDALTPVREQVRLDVFAWAPSDVPAMTLALQARTLIWALAGKSTLGFMVYRVQEFLGPTKIRDPIRVSPQVWATYDLDIRANAAIHQAA